VKVQTVKTTNGFVNEAYWFQEAEWAVSVDLSHPYIDPQVRANAQRTGTFVELKQYNSGNGYHETTIRFPYDNTRWRSIGSRSHSSVQHMLEQAVLRFMREQPGIDQRVVWNPEIV
jgi:hypothetical protein